MLEQLHHEDVRSFAKHFEADPKNRLALNAVTKSGLASIALNRDIVNQTHHTYSHLIETPEATKSPSGTEIAREDQSPASSQVSPGFRTLWARLACPA